MKTQRITVKAIPAIRWGEECNVAIIAIHGNMSSKEDTIIRTLSDIVTNKGYQILNFDLPEHGDRIQDKTYLCNPKNCSKKFNCKLDILK